MLVQWLLFCISFSTVFSRILEIPENEAPLLLADTSEANWWKTATIYQIYPKSFRDSNKDGIGDLRGIIEKLEYINTLGVQAIWLSPIFDSPQKDNGYDISNYTKIWSTFGTNADFKELVDKAHRLGLRVLIDFVPNHTSDQHVWFQKSIKKEKDFEDYYIWKNCTVDDKGVITKLPNNWVSTIYF